MFDTVQVGIDFKPLSETALAAASALADRFGSKNLHLVHAVEMLRYAPGSSRYEADAFSATWEETLAEANARLADFAVPATRAKITRVTRVGAPARELAEEAEDKHADLIVVATHDRSSVQRFVLGSVANTLLRVSSCPVWIVGKDRPGTLPIRRVLAAIDLSPVSDRVLDAAARVAAVSDAKLTVLSLYELPLLLHGRPVPIARAEDIEPFEAAYRARVEARVAAVRAPGRDITVEVLAKAPPRNAIMDVAELLPADLIVVGTSGHNAWQRFFLGSTATGVVTQAPCPVLVVPHPDGARPERK
jgi:nucleotide-binding universal stress UspA family protein